MATNITPRVGLQSVPPAEFQSKNYATLDAGGFVEQSPDWFTHIGDYGEIGGANASAAVQAMVDETGGFQLPLGTFTCQDPIVVPAHSETLLSIGARFSGQGKEKSILRAVDMAGTDLIKASGVADGLYRVHMADFQADGDADRAVAFDLSDAEGDQSILYESSFTDMVLSSGAGPSFYANKHFATRWVGLSLNSDEDNAIEIGGGNSTLLANCYAHKAGTGKAGFRIWGGGTLLECVGVDSSVSYWGHFGRVSPVAYYSIQIIGGNAEDFGDIGVRLSNSGHIDFKRFPFVAKKTGSFETYIKTEDTNVHYITRDHISSFVSKGATRTGAADVVHAVGGRVYTDDPEPQSITANAATFINAKGYPVLKTANTLATNLTNITGSYRDGDSLTLLIGDANTTIKHGVGGAGRFIMMSAGDETPASGAVYFFIRFNNIWIQV